MERYYDIEVRIKEEKYIKLNRKNSDMKETGK